MRDLAQNWHRSILCCPAVVKQASASGNTSICICISTLLACAQYGSLGQCYSNTDEECASSNISSFWAPPQTRENGTNRVVLNMFFFSPEWAGAADELQVLPIAWKTEMTSQDYTEWYNFEFEYCNQGFETAQALADALANGTLYVCSPKQWTSLNYNDNWLADRYQGPPREGSTKAGPRLYEPQGKRFTLLQGDSPSSRVFQYMGWQAHVTVDPWTGLSLHDVNFLGERIAYEISVQDQFVAYSGYSSIGQAFYFDDSYQLGASSYQLKPGMDCPETATYMDIEMMGEFGYLIQSKAAVCFFEDWTLGTTTWRHTDVLEDGTLRNNGVRNYEFVVRTIATVGNYDYMYDVRFALDGAITCRVYQAGYMQAAYWDPAGGTSKDLPFGTVVHTYTLGNIHDHLSGWKIDLDIVGQSNSFHQATLGAGTFDEVFGPGNTPMWALPTDVVKYQKDQLITNEQGFNLQTAGQSTFKITNDKALNSFNQSRGYAIIHTGATASQLLPDNHPLVIAQSWTKYHIAVTQRKEEEPTVSKDYYDTHSPAQPIWSLDMALNNETIVGQDLVAWVMCGIVHVPRSEDAPLITNVGTQFEIRPVNYFDTLATMDVFDENTFEPCTPQHGDAYDYSYNTSGDNINFNKMTFKYNR